MNKEEVYGVLSVEEAERRVAKGRKFLNKNQRGWIWDIKSSELAMQNPDHCVMGQIGQAAGGYNYSDFVKWVGEDDSQTAMVEFRDGCVIPALAMTHKQAVKRGFNLLESVSGEDESWHEEDRRVSQSWAVLNDTWQRAIKDEREQRRELSALRLLDMTIPDTCGQETYDVIQAAYDKANESTL